jgi:hypothetical protein
VARRNGDGCMRSIAVSGPVAHAFRPQLAAAKTGFFRVLSARLSMRVIRVETMCRVDLADRRLAHDDVSMGVG